MTQTYDVQVRFRTAQPLSQDAGMKFWERGNHFTSLPGRASYQFTTRADAESMYDATVGVCLVVDMLVAADVPRWPEVEYFNSSVSLISE